MAKKFFELIQDKSQQTDGSGPALFNLFNKRVKENLHIIFAMSPLSPEFKSFIASKCLNIKRFADISFQPTACISLSSTKGSSQAQGKVKTYTAQVDWVGKLLLVE